MSSPAQLANGLYPIIRRVRRPLIAADALPDVVADIVAEVEPVPPLAVKAEDEKPVEGRAAKAGRRGKIEPTE